MTKNVLDELCAARVIHGSKMYLTVVCDIFLLHTVLTSIMTFCAGCSGLYSSVHIPDVVITTVTNSCTIFLAYQMTEITSFVHYTLLLTVHTYF